MNFEDNRKLDIQLSYMVETDTTQYVVFKKNEKAPIPLVSRLPTLSKESYIDRVPIGELACGTYPTRFLSLR